MEIGETKVSMLCTYWVNSALNNAKMTVQSFPPLKATHMSPKLYEGDITITTAHYTTLHYSTLHYTRRLHVIKHMDLAGQ